MAEWSNTERHILFSSPSVGVNVFHVCLDVLHVLDLGICQHICASAVGGEAGCRVGADVHRQRCFGHGRR